MAKKPTRVELLKEVETLRKRVAKLECSSTSDQMPPELEWALRERVKELDCLYTISTLQDAHFHSTKRFLQSVADCLPRSWQFPEYACARIVYGDREYVTEGFNKSKWRMAADVLADRKPVGTVEVFYRKVVPTAAEGPFLKEE